MDKKYDVVSVGDLMIDFTYVGENSDGISTYERNPGGSPMNVAAQVVRLGGKASVITTVGDDEHGHYLQRVMKGIGVDTSNIKYSKTAGTRMLFVHFKDENDRYFIELKGPRADLDINIQEIDTECVAKSRVFLYTPLAHETEYPIYQTVKELLKIARKQNILIAYDPNYRFPYKTKEEHDRVVEAIRTSHILKLTIEELNLILGEQDVLKATEELLAGTAKMIAITMGKDGCILRNCNGWVCRPSYDVPVQDTTGAGDSFMGALLYSITHEEKQVEEMTEDDLKKIADFCNACASGTTMKRGSLLVMPDRERADRIVNEVPRVQ